MSIKKNIFIVCCVKGISSFASSVMFVSLALFLNEKFHIEKSQAAEITGTYLALFYGLPLVAGYLGGKFLSLKKLYMAGMVVQAIGYWFFAFASQVYLLDLGLSLIVIGSSINSVGILEFIAYITRFENANKNSMMLFYYASMNVGFIAGGTFAGIISLSRHFSVFFIGLSFAPLICAGMVYLWISYQSSRFEHVRFFIIKMIIFFIFLILSVFLLFFCGHQSKGFLLSLVLMCLLGAVFYVYKKSSLVEKTKILILSFYLFFWIFYWGVYLLMPTMFMYFMRDWVLLDWRGFQIQPQWLENLDAILIVIFTPLIAYGLKKFDSFQKSSRQTSVLFGNSLLCVAISAGIMMYATHFTLEHIKIPMAYMLSYIGVLSIGELLIAAEGYALPAKLSPSSYRSLLNGVWVASMSVSSLLASFISHYFFSRAPVVTPANYHNVFFYIFLTALTSILIIALFAILQSKSSRKQTSRFIV